MISAGVQIFLSGSSWTTTLWDYWSLSSTLVFLLNLEVKNPNILAMPMDVIGSVLSVSVSALRMPRSWVCTALYGVQKCPEVNGIVTQYWSIIPGGIYQVLYKPITGVDRCILYTRMQQCRLECRIWGEYTQYVTTLPCYDCSKQ